LTPRVRELRCRCQERPDALEFSVPEVVRGFLTT
jgi:hypothetical protein